MKLLKANNKWAALAGPGGFNDPDMLEVGVKRAAEFGPMMTRSEQLSHFALWALMKSPLLIGADIRADHGFHQWELDILLDEEIIAVNQ
eukprot:scaffold25395_cov35-Prasinocladus_malaysianus.AAC.1